MSEWCQIENHLLTVQLTSKGAEMKRFFQHAWNRELLWLGDKKSWERSAPILFPIVGRLKNDEYNFKDKKYSLTQHGFARDMEFSCTRADAQECEFILSANRKTFDLYPFLFELKVHYSLEGAKLNIAYTVKNCDRQNIYFSLGAHPGFETPNIDEFEIHFEKEEEGYYLTKDGLLDLSQHILLKNRSLSLDKDLFAKGALVFKHPKSKHIDLVKKDLNQVIRLSATHMPYLGIWGKGEVPFVCLEPWHGVADLIDHDQNLETKEGIITLKENEEFSFRYSIEAI